MAALRRLGLLVPATDEVTEVDFHHFLPRGVVFHTARLKQGRAARIGTAENYANLVDSIEATAESVALASPELIVYCCTSGSFFKGKGWDLEVARRIEAATGIPGLTTSTAVREALGALGARTVFMVTPYPDSVNEAEIRFFGEHGFDIPRSHTFGCVRSRELVAVTPARIRDSLLQRRDELRGCDAALISCTGLRAIDMVEELEAALDLPVVTSNQATLWAALRRLGVDGSGVRAGRLFRPDTPPGRSRVA